MLQLITVMVLHIPDFPPVLLQSFAGEEGLFKALSLFLCSRNSPANLCFSVLWLVQQLSRQTDATLFPRFVEATVARGLEGDFSSGVATALHRSRNLIGIDHPALVALMLLTETSVVPETCSSRIATNTEAMAIIGSSTPLEICV